MSVYLMSRLFKHRMGHPNRKLLAIRMADHADDDGRGIWPAVETLAEQTELSVRTVQRIISDFLAEGILVLRHKASGRPGETNRYDFDLDALFRTPDAPEEAKETGDSVSPVEPETGDSEGGDGCQPVADGCHPDTRTVMEPSRNLQEREAREREDLGSEDDQKLLDARFDALMIGQNGNPWPNVLQKSKRWAFEQFVKLSPEERKRAEEKRDAYLARCPKVQHGPRKGQPDAAFLGIYLRDKLFDVLEAMESRKVAASSSAGSPRVTVSVLGPVWAAAAFIPTLGRPDPVRLPDNHRETVAASYDVKRRIAPAKAFDYLASKGITLGQAGELIFPPDFERQEERRLRMADGYPETRRLYEVVKDSNHVTVDARYEALKADMEFVMLGTEMLDEWRDYYARNYLPFPPLGARGGYFPKGGPARLDDFRAAAQAALNTAQNEASDDAA